jgi:hypothetical protein
MHDVTTPRNGLKAAEAHVLKGKMSLPESRLSAQMPRRCAISGRFAQECATRFLQGDDKLVTRGGAHYGFGNVR